MVCSKLQVNSPGWDEGVGVCMPIQAKEARRERDQQVAKAQMEAALSRGVSWGMGEDAGPGDGSSDEVLVWRRSLNLES